MHSWADAPQTEHLPRSAPPRPSKATGGACDSPACLPGDVGVVMVAAWWLTDRSSCGRAGRHGGPVGSTACAADRGAGAHPVAGQSQIGDDWQVVGAVGAEHSGSASQDVIAVQDVVEAGVGVFGRVRVAVSEAGLSPRVNEILSNG